MNRKDMKMKDLCADERPMEKMRDKGVFSLSNAELIAILLGSGTRSMNAVDVARELLKSGVEAAQIPFVAINKFAFLPAMFVLLMSMFYVTSSDSQSFAMDNLISAGSKIPVLYRKIMWVLLEVLFVTVLLLAGSGTTSAVQGLSFLFVPFMILIAALYWVLLIRFIIKRRIEGSEK